MNASEHRVEGIIEQMKLEVIRLEAQKELLEELIQKIKESKPILSPTTSKAPSSDSASHVE